MAEHVLADLDGRIALVLDSGATHLGLESTVLDLTRSPARILRPGPIGPGELDASLEGLDQIDQAGQPPSQSDAPASPGMLPAHYAPRTPAWRLESLDQITSLPRLDRASLLVFGAVEVTGLPRAIDLIRLEDPQLAGKCLYLVLHDLDARSLDTIVVLLPPDLPEWSAVRDRLIRATRAPTS
jgi:L-threonylcarbamoyladenylate synthase